jgi:hypothetical protein
VADRSVVLTRLAQAIATADPQLSLSAWLCSAGVRVLGAGGGAITVANAEPERLTLHATDTVAAQLEELEEVLGEGPSLDAYTSGSPVLADLSEQSCIRRWPVLTSTVLGDIGAVTVLAVPMRPDRETVGVFAIHDLPRMPIEELTGSAQLLADTIAIALVENAGPWNTTADDTWPTWARIHQAIGMVIAQLQVSPDDAEALLRAHAYASDTTLGDIAGHVVDRRLAFSHDAVGDIRNGDA